MKCDAVSPVPSPTTMFGVTNSAAASPAALRPRCRPSASPLALAGDAAIEGCTSFLLSFSLVGIG
jgi:hypothetical protein